MALLVGQTKAWRWLNMLKTSFFAKQKHKYIIGAIFWLGAIALGGLQAWANRYTLSTGDAVAYLDIGDAYFRGDWEQALNTYFSPLYSWILGLVLNLLQPSTYWEFFAVKLANFLIFLFSFLCFEFFLSEFIFYYQKQLLKSPGSKYLVIPEWTIRIVGYLLFLWSALEWIGIDNDTPDMLVAAWVYLATAIVLRVHARSDHWLNFIFLGAVVGLGYLSKTFLFPMAFIFLGTAFFSVGNIRRAIPRIGVAALVFVLIATPWIVAISEAQGEMTFGTAGKLNYAWLVSPGGISNHNWQGEPPGSGVPAHPTRQIFDAPIVYEFSTPIGGTYPPWHNPTYWNQGLKSNFNLPKQIAVLQNNAFKYYEIFFGVLISGYLMLVIFSGNFWLSLQQLLGNWRLLIPACAGLGSLMLVHVKPRLIASLAVLLFAGFFSSIRLPNTGASKRLVAGLTVALLIWVGSQLVALPESASNHLHWQIARELQELGIDRGDRVAILGSYRVGDDYYWARLARVKIVAEIPSIPDFWQSEPEAKAEIYEAIAQFGAEAIVMKPGDNSPDYLPASGWSAIGEDYISARGWQEIGETGSYVYFLDNQKQNQSKEQ